MTKNKTATSYNTNIIVKKRLSMRIIATFIMAFSLQTTYAQIADNTDRHNDKNIYWQALKCYLDFMAKKSVYSELKQIDTIYVDKDTKTTDSLLDNIGSTKIIMVKNPYTLIKSRGGRGITLYSIFPLDFEKGEFWVSFVPFSVSIDIKQEQRLLFENPGGYKVVFKFDKGHFVFVRIEDHGI
jgi:hypothetical protein